MHDIPGRTVGYVARRCPTVTRVSPVKSVKAVQGVKSVRGVASGHRIHSLGRSDLSLTDFLDQGRR